MLAQGDDVWFFYLNHRGESGWRHVRPFVIYFGTSEYHEGRQWFLRGFDFDRGAERTFALRDLSQWRNTAPIFDKEGEPCKR